MRPILLVAAVLAAVTAGCGPGATTQVRADSPPGLPPGLRGFVAGSFTCNTTTTGQAVAVPASAVQAFLVCPLAIPADAGVPRRVVPADATYAGLLQALALPDLPHSTGPCPAVANATQTVLADTLSGAYRISIPVDACGLYRSAALRAVGAATGSGG